MSNSTWKSWQLTELSAKSLNQEIADSNAIKLNLDKSIDEFQKKIELFEKNKQEAMNEAIQQGIKLGKDEGFELGYKEGFDLGESKVKEEFESNLRKKLTQVEDIVNEFNAYLRNIKSLLPSEIARIISSAVDKILDTGESTYHPNLLEHLNMELTHFENQCNQLTLKVNSSDFSEIEARFSELFKQQNWKIIMDNSLKSGGFILDSDVFKIDSTIETRRSKIMELVKTLDTSNE